RVSLLPQVFDVDARPEQGRPPRHVGDQRVDALGGRLDHGGVYPLDGGGQRCLAHRTSTATPLTASSMSRGVVSSVIVSSSICTPVICLSRAAASISASES